MSEGASEDTHAAAYASKRVYEHEALVGFVDGSRGAHGHAWRISAVLTPHRYEEAGRWNDPYAGDRLGPFVGCRKDGFGR